MKTKRNLVRIAVVGIAAVGVWMLISRTVRAHCDTLDGPVVTTAKTALNKGDVTPVLKWVQKKDEQEIKMAFENTLAVRKLSPQAKELADMYFFETLIRIHRAGEGEPYTGLKPAGTAVEPGIAAADKALDSGSVNDLVKEITEVVSAGIRERFNHAMEAKKHADENVESGREFVKVYIEFVHYVEKLHSDALMESVHHAHTPEKEATAHHEQ